MKNVTRSFFVSTISACGAMLLASPAWSQSATNVTLHAAAVKTTLALPSMAQPLVSVSGEVGQINLLGNDTVTTSLPLQSLSLLGMQVATITNGSATASVCSSGNCPALANVALNAGTISLLGGLATIVPPNSVGGIDWNSLPALQTLTFDASVTTGSGTRSVASHCPSRPGDTPPGTQIPVAGPVTQTLLDPAGAVTGIQALQFHGHLTVNDPCVATTNASGDRQFAPISLTGTMSGPLGLDYAEIEADVGFVQLSL